MLVVVFHFSLASVTGSYWFVLMFFSADEFFSFLFIDNPLTLCFVLWSGLRWCYCLVNGDMRCHFLLVIFCSASQHLWHGVQCYTCRSSIHFSTCTVDSHHSSITNCSIVAASVIIIFWMKKLKKYKKGKIQKNCNSATVIIDDCCASSKPGKRRRTVGIY